MGYSQIWTEDENDERTFQNMVNHKDKSCLTCYWGMTDEISDFVTCGHHHENFTKNSFCSFHTEKNDKNLKAYQQKRQTEFKAKYK